MPKPATLEEATERKRKAIKQIQEVAFRFQNPDLLPEGYGASLNRVNVATLEWLANLVVELRRARETQEMPF